MASDEEAEINTENATDVTAEVENADENNAVVNRQASIADVVQEPKELLNENSFDSVFELYDRLIEMDGELAGTIRAQSQLASGFDIIHPATEGTNESPSGNDEVALKECKEMAESIDLELLQPSMFANMVGKGNDISKIVYEDGVGVKNLQSIPSTMVTIVGDDNSTGVTEVQRKVDSGDEISFGDYQEFVQKETVYTADEYILNEGTSHEKSIDAADILHLAVERRSNWFEDKLGRKTYGVWGAPRIESVKFNLQAKHNTLANKVAMDDSLIAREVYKIDVDTLFGHIKNDQDRQRKAEEYATSLKKTLEEMNPDEKPILPDPVSVEVHGPNGKARENAQFLEMMNNAIMHALTFHTGGMGRDASGPMIGNRPAKDTSMNNVAHLRKIQAHNIERLFKIHLMLKHEDWRNENNSDNIDDWELTADIVMPKILFDSLEDGDMERVVNQATKAYEKRVITRNEAREWMGLNPMEGEDDQLKRDPSIEQEDREQDKHEIEKKQKENDEQRKQNEEDRQQDRHEKLMDRMDQEDNQSDDGSDEDDSAALKAVISNSPQNIYDDMYHDYEMGVMAMADDAAENRSNV